MLHQSEANRRYRRHDAPEDHLKTTLPIISALVFSTAILFPHLASAQNQNNVPAAAQQVAAETESFVERYGIGAEAGIGLDPELIMFGAHGTFGPVVTRSVSFRPGIEFGVGEVTTVFGINLDVLYRFPGVPSTARWAPYVGVGPNFELSHRGFETAETDKVSTTGTAGTTTTTSTGTATTATTTDSRSRFNFSDTDFESGFNFIAGARSRSGLFIEMKTTAYGVSNVRLLAGFNF